MKWFLMVFKRFTDFSGRSRRMEYWMFTLFNVLISVVLTLIDMNIGADIQVFSLIYGLFAFIPSLAVCLRRLHDIGKSGWNYLWVLLPIIGWIMVIVWFCTEGETGDNEWGSDPKSV